MRLKGITDNGIHRLARVVRNHKNADNQMEPTLSTLGGHGVDIKLKDMRSNDQVYWTDKRKNSYVVVGDDNGAWVTATGIPVTVYSINGIGEIRWDIPSYFIRKYDKYLETGEKPGGDGEEMAEVLDYFNLDVNTEHPSWGDYAFER